jgi:spore coat polysaccharide biosynthesis protein SpsF
MWNKPVLTRIVIQARVGSSRLPGKILLPLAGRPLLAHVVQRLRAVQEFIEQPLEVMVATTHQAGDDATATVCRDLHVPCHRGEPVNVLARYLAAAADLGDEDVVIRATADNPLYCPRRTAMILRQHLAAGMDYTGIEGLSAIVPEVIGTGALRAMAPLVKQLGAAEADYCREHVTPYFRRPGAPFRVQLLPKDWQGLRPDVRLTVDTPADYAAVKSIFDAAGTSPPAMWTTRSAS